MPDSLVSACNQLDGVQVLWVSRYGAGGNLFLDLEAVEALTQNPPPRATRSSTCCRSRSAPTGAMRLRRKGDRASRSMHRTSAAPEATDGPPGLVPRHGTRAGWRCPPDWEQARRRHPRRRRADRRRGRAGAVRPPRRPRGPRLRARPARPPGRAGRLDREGGLTAVAARRHRRDRPPRWPDRPAAGRRRRRAAAGGPRPGAGAGAARHARSPRRRTPTATPYVGRSTGSTSVLMVSGRRVRGPARRAPGVRRRRGRRPGCATSSTSRSSGPRPTRPSRWPATTTSPSSTSSTPGWPGPSCATTSTPTSCRCSPVTTG